MERSERPADKSRDFTENTKNSAVITLCTAVSRLLGIIRISVMSSIFGAGSTADVLNFTFNIPNNFRKLLAEGGLTSAFIPTLTKAMRDRKRTASIRLVREMLGFQLIIFIPLTALSFLFSEQIVGFLSDFSQPEKIKLAAAVLPLFVIYLGMIAYISVFNALLNSSGLFILAAAAPLTYSLSVIASLLLFSEPLGAFSFPLGVLFGGMLHLLLLSLKVFRTGYSPLPALDLKSTYIREVGRNWLPVMGASMITIINQQITFFLASGLTVGSVTAFSNAIIFWQLPYGLFFNAAATVYFPRMSHSHHAGDRSQTAGYLTDGLEYLFLFLLPSALLLLFFSREYVAAILFRGAYTLEDTILTAKTVRMFALGIIPAAVFSLQLRLLYALQKYSLALIAALGTALLDISISIGFFAGGFDVSYLALAHTLSFTTGSIVLFAALRHRHVLPLQYRLLVKSGVKITALNIPLGVYLIMAVTFVPDFWQNGSSAGTIAAAAALSLGAAAVILVSYHLGGIHHVRVFSQRRKGNRRL